MAQRIDGVYVRSLRGRIDASRSKEKAIVI
jgi:hypothetical protein